MPCMAAHQLALVIIKFHTLDVCLHLCGREQGGCCSAFSSSPHTVGRVNCPIRIQSKTVKNMNSACREWSNQITLQADLLLTEASWCQSEAHREWLRNKTLCKCRLQTLILYRCCRARVTASVTATLTYKDSKRVWAQPSVLHLKRWVDILYASCSR